jgi:hypothetical protein
MKKVLARLLLALALLAAPSCSGSSGSTTGKSVTAPIGFIELRYVQDSTIYLSPEELQSIDVDSDPRLSQAFRFPLLEADLANYRGRWELRVRLGDEGRYWGRTVSRNQFATQANGFQILICINDEVADAAILDGDKLMPVLALRGIAGNMTRVEAEALKSKIGSASIEKN